MREEALATASRELGGITDVAAFAVDVRDRDGLASARERIESELGPADMIVANAGVGLGAFQPLRQELAYSTWDYVVGINLDGVNNTIQTFLPPLLDRGGAGHIVTTASAAGLAVFPERSSGYTYHASKFAVIGLTEALRRGLHDIDADVSASVLIPGLVATSVAQNSVKHAPTSSLDPADTGRIQEMVTAGTAAAAAYGRDVDSVGELTLAAVEQDALYIPTDRLAENALTARAAAIVEAMPDASTHDTGLSDAMRERRRT